MIPTPTSKPPLINYISYIKVLSIHSFDLIIESVLKNQSFNGDLHTLKYNKFLISQELLKAFMCQIPSLKTLDNHTTSASNIQFTLFPGAKYCLTNLTVFSCNSDIYPEFFYQLASICHKIRSITINFKNDISGGLKELILFQNNLKYLKLTAGKCGEKVWADIIPAITKHHDTLTRLHIDMFRVDMPLSIITVFTNLRELIMSCFGTSHFKVSNELQRAIYPNLRILRIPFQCPSSDILTKLLENNGKNLYKLDLGGIDNSLKLNIAQLCPNLKKLYMMFENDEMDIFKGILCNCQHLEGIKVWCGCPYLDEMEMLETVVKYSPKCFHELRIYSRTFPEYLESFFSGWENRTPPIPLSLIINIGSLAESEEKIDICMKTTIAKYKNLGIIKKFETEEFEYEDYI
ncbi:16992_t:CDS:1 [Funneliformis geosporum]|uniref:16992_t:CDS:1 n=1 Tax=Funneliformis geosporum TaxID=1117311 RepID=A0A9W4SRK5_9GLOM|nr:16992_t:CDS:1 [Funneliformis geosporum]